MPNKIVIPERIQLEAVFGCNASCIMCPVNIPSKREKGVMSQELFQKIIDEMAPFKDRIDKLDLWGLGEPLLDRNLYQKIKYAKSKGFRNLAIATNADLLKEEYQQLVLESGLDTVIFSIDGSTKATHENIRVNTHFDNVIDNARSIIDKRNRGSYRTRFVFRFIRQETNKQEWGAFQEYWKSKIATDRGDIIIGYDAHSLAEKFHFLMGKAWRGRRKSSGNRVTTSMTDLSSYMTVQCPCAVLISTTPTTLWATSKKPL